MKVGEGEIIGVLQGNGGRPLFFKILTERDVMMEARRLLQRLTSLVRSSPPATAVVS